jgi:hypothetical protein
VIGEAPVPVRLPGVDVAVNVVVPVPAVPAVYATVAEAFPAVAVPIVGAPGAIPGTAAADGEVDEPPYALVTLTPNVYDVPLVRPVTVNGFPVVFVAVKPPGLEVATNVFGPVPGVPVTEIVTCPLPIAIIVGAAVYTGAIPGVMVFDEEEARDSAPVLDMAVTVKETAVPIVNPVLIEKGDALVV